jgi:hypothetical protein
MNRVYVTRQACEEPANGRVRATARQRGSGFVTVDELGDTPTRPKPGEAQTNGAAPMSIVGGDSLSP